MRIVAILALLLGIGLAGGAVLMMSGKFKEMQLRLAQAPKAEKIPTVMIAVAKEELRYGKKIGKDSVRLVEWPADAAPANSFNTIEDLFQEEGQQRTVLRQMEPNEVVLKSKVTGFGEEATVAALLRRGMRAHTLSVDVNSSVAGFIYPGSRVDIYLTYNGPSGQRTKLFLENGEIIAVDQTTDKDSIKTQVARTVTLEVTPEDSQRLILAERIGSLSFNLRGMGDESPLLEEGQEAIDLSIGDILGIKVKEEEVVETDKVRVRRGISLKEQIEVKEGQQGETEPKAEETPAASN